MRGNRRHEEYGSSIAEKCRDGDATRIALTKRNTGDVCDGAHDEPSSGCGRVRGGGCAKVAAKGSGASNTHLLSGQVSRSRVVALPFSRRLGRAGDIRSSVSRGV
eukprot:3509830-Pleurochrysis_carterae.AAC.1